MVYSMADLVLMGREEQHRLVRCSTGSLSRLHNNLEMIPCCSYQDIRGLKFRDAPVSGTVTVVTVMDKCPSVKLEMEYITRHILALVSGKAPDLYAFDIQRLGPVLPKDNLGWGLCLWKQILRKDDSLSAFYHAFEHIIGIVVTMWMGNEQDIKHFGKFLRIRPASPPTYVDSEGPFAGLENVAHVIDLIDSKLSLCGRYAFEPFDGLSAASFQVSVPRYQVFLFLDRVHGRVLVIDMKREIHHHERVAAEHGGEIGFSFIHNGALQFFEFFHERIGIAYPSVRIVQMSRLDLVEEFLHNLPCRRTFGILSKFPRLCNHSSIHLFGRLRFPMLRIDGECDAKYS